MVDRAGDRAPAVYADITQPAERRDIIPVQFQRAQLRGTLTYHAGLSWHRARFHGLRIVFYIVAIVVWSVVGVVRLAARQVRRFGAGHVYQVKLSILNRKK